MSTGWRVAGVVTGAVMALVVRVSDAEAYVRYQTASGIGFAWKPSCLPLSMVAYPGTFSQMTISEVTSAVTGAAAAWSAEANPCTFIEIGVTVASGPAPRAANDGRNTIILRDAGWCRLDATGACDPTSTAYDPASLALTTVSARTSTGEILDADLEINASQFLWGDLIAHPELVDRHDLQNVLTHEMGHVLGLDHSCLTAAGPIRANDNTGQPVPDCASASASVLATTMFPSSAAGEVERRTLEADDRTGVCGIYPAASTPCPSGADGGCTCAAPGTDGGQDAGGDARDAVATDASGTDASATDTSATDASATDASTMNPGSGCSCDIGRRSSERSGPFFLFLAAAVAAALRGRTRRAGRLSRTLPAKH